MKKFRQEFPFFEEHPSLIYFDAAASTQKPKIVIESMNAFYSFTYATVHRGIYKHAREATSLYEDVRKKVKEFIGAKDDSEIIFTRGTTSALNLVARSFGKAFLKEGDVVLLPTTEHHSNIVPWQLLAEERGVKLDFIPVDERGEIILSEFEKKLSPQVKLITLAHISNVVGAVHPIEKITQMAHKVGAKVCIDGAQSAAHIPLNVSSLDVDFFAFSAHKLYGPTGVGILYGKKEYLEKMPPYEGGGDMIEKVTLAKSSFAPPPLRFEAGTPMIAEVIGLGAAIDFISKIGLENIAAWEDELVTYALEKLQKIPQVKVLGPPKKRGSMISFVVENVHPLDIATFLDCKEISIRTGHHCSQPTMEHFKISSSLRLSFALYNTKEEIDRFILALTEVISSLTS